MYKNKENNFTGLTEEEVRRSREEHGSNKPVSYTHLLLTDGAMGTYFDSIEKENYICSEEANITNPALVREIHRSYVKNGAQLLRSNTFLANEGTFLSLTQAKAEAFENITLKQLIIAGYQLAKETAQEVYQEEYPIFAAADIGPILEERDLSLIHI